MIITKELFTSRKYHTEFITQSKEQITQRFTGEVKNLHRVTQSFITQSKEQITQRFTGKVKDLHRVSQSPDSYRGAQSNTEFFTEYHKISQSIYCPKVVNTRKKTSSIWLAR